MVAIAKNLPERKINRKITILIGILLSLIVFLAGTSFYFYLQTKALIAKEGELKRTTFLQQQEIANLSQQATTLESKINNLWQLRENLSPSPRPGQ